MVRAKASEQLLVDAVVRLSGTESIILNYWVYKNGHHIKFLVDQYSKEKCPCQHLRPDVRNISAVSTI